MGMLGEEKIKLVINVAQKLPRNACFVDFIHSL
jgi:hypothetical protein